MEFLVILFMVGVVFYIVIIAPALKARKILMIRIHLAPALPAIGCSNSTERPKMSPLLGIEISASQRRRLGRHDPSVMAAKLYQQQNINLPVFNRPGRSLIPSP